MQRSRIIKPPKDVADDYIKLTIFKLNQHTSIRYTTKGNMTWSSYFDPDFKLDYSVYYDWMYWEDSSIQLTYKDCDVNGREIRLHYKVNLTTTPCTYGGERFWFICPGLKNGIPCKRRVGVLYKPKRGCPYFACLHCYDLTYESSKTSGRLRSRPLSIPEIEDLKSSITKRFYKGKFTKKYNRYITEVVKFKEYHPAFQTNIMKKLGKSA